MRGAVILRRRIMRDRARIRRKLKRSNLGQTAIEIGFGCLLAGIGRAIATFRDE